MWGGFVKSVFGSSLGWPFASIVQAAGNFLPSARSRLVIAFVAIDIETSRITQDTFENCEESWKLRAEVKIAVRNPSDLSKLSSASQID